MPLKPKSFSASAFQVAETCMSRYHAENILRTPRPPHRAADLGTAVHAALEKYVEMVYIKKEKPASLEALVALYRLYFMSTFGTVQPEENSWYAEGLAMVKSWYARTDFSNREVLSVETKTSFPIKTSIGEIPFNYIFDRMDRMTDRPDEYEIVDYKTIRRALSPADLKKKIQARFYGLAGQIQFPNAKRIWVRFDLLRYDSVATAFSRDENIATWNFAKALAEKIIATDTDDLVQTLNPECGFCVMKASCETLGKNITGGGVWSVPTQAERIDLLARLDFQRKGIDRLHEEISELVLREAAETEQLEFQTDLYTAKVVQSFRRAVDAERVKHVIGPELYMEFGGSRMTMGDHSNLMKDRRLTPEQKAEIKSLVYRTAGDPRVVVELNNPIDD